MSTPTIIREPKLAICTRFTPREQQVIDLICSGYSNKQIAHQLSTSVDNVKATSSHVYWKLGLNHSWGCPRVRLVLWATKARLSDAA